MEPNISLPNLLLMIEQIDFYIINQKLGDFFAIVSRRGIIWNLCEVSTTTAESLP